MTSAKRVGRMIAVLLLLQMICGPVVNFVLMKPVLAAPGFLASAAPHSMQVGLAVLVGLAMGALTVGIAIAALPVFRRYSRGMAYWLLALAIAGFSANVVENIDVMSMLSLSQAHAKAGTADAELFQALAGVVAASRNWAHYTGLVFAGCVAFLLYGTMFRFALVPRLLAGFGAIAALLEIAGSGMPFFGGRVVFVLLMPLGLSHLALCAWLMAKGLADRPAAASDSRE